MCGQVDVVKYFNDRAEMLLAEVQCLALHDCAPGRGAMLQRAQRAGGIARLGVLRSIVVIPAWHRAASQQQRVDAQSS